MSQLGGEPIAAYAPQPSFACSVARGRSGQVFDTLRDGLATAFMLAGISSVAAANQWLRQTVLAAHNARFAVDAEQEGPAFVADTTGARRAMPSVQEDRTVGNDITMRWR